MGVLSSTDDSCSFARSVHWSVPSASDTWSSSRGFKLDTDERSGHDVQFHASDAPPTLSDELASHLAVTTFQHCEASPVSVANHLLEFFNAVACVRIGKV